DVLIDDVPDKITLSSFDPLRRHVAKVALEKLIQDGRIQPAKIDEIVEKAQIAGMLATELGADADIARAGALLHDIGKAVDHEVSGTHVEIGRRILEKFSVDKKVIQAMQSHHEEYPYETPESMIVQVADAVSGGRPGARRDTVERYLERLGDLERIATSFEGVEKAYAIQAGREIRVFVNPGKVSDIAMHKMARDIAVRVQEE